MDDVKEAFQRVKEDMGYLKQEIDDLRLSLINTNRNISELGEVVKEISEKTIELFEKQTNIIEESAKYSNSINQNIPTIQHKIPTLQTYPSTHNYSLTGLKHQNIAISTGNEGVPTDKQTNRQTDRQPQNTHKNEEQIGNVIEILNSLDNIKKEIRLKFKRLTDQEFLVFSTLYQLEEESGYTDYKTISTRLNLTESSIRDYIGRLIKKGIPVEKSKINNKNIKLSISENLKKIATLPTILQLRDL